MECKDQADALRWCLAFQNVKSTRCQPLLEELSRCVAKALL
jgi:hypothetical protein